MEKNVEIYHLMIDKKIDHIGIADTGRHWPYLPEYDRIYQIFRGHLMSQKLDATTAYNWHESL